MKTLLATKDPRTVGSLCIAVGIFALALVMSHFQPEEPRALAVVAAFQAASRQLRHPSAASFPYPRERVVVPVGNGRWDVYATVAGPNQLGMKVERNFIARVFVPKEARSVLECSVESLQFEY